MSKQTNTGTTRGFTLVEVMIAGALSVVVVGTALAAFLARKGASVVIFDDGARPPLIVGESLVPQLIPIFRKLGIEEEVAKIGVYKPGVTVTFTPEEELKLSFTAARGVLPTYAYNVRR